MPLSVTLRVCLFAGFVGLSIGVAQAAKSEWTGPTNGDFGDPANWSAGVPGAADTATFDIGGSYGVIFDNSPNPLNSLVENQALNVANAGTVTFASGADGPYTYHLTGAGTNSVTISAGTLNLGTINAPLHIDADDNMIVRGISTMNINFGSQVDAGALRVGAESGGTGGSGLINVDGTDGPSRLNVSGDTTLGAFGTDGTITYRDDAQGNLSTTGTVYVGVDSSGFSGTNGTINVQNGADVLVGNVLIGTGSNGSGMVTLSSGTAGTSVEHIGASTLTIGNDLSGGSPVGTLNLNGGTYTVGTGKTTVRGRGLISITGQFRTSGDVEVVNASGAILSAEIDIFSGSLVQTGATNFTIGASSGGPSRVEFHSSPGSISTGTGTMTIKRTGIVDMNGGNLAVNGDLVIDGGVLDRSSSASINIAAGRTMTVKSGGDFLSDSSYVMSPGSTIHVTGNGSLLQSNFSGFTVNDAELQLSAAGTVSVGTLTVGSGSSLPGTSGTIRATGVGTTIGTGSATFGTNNGSAIIELSDRATAIVGGVLTVGTNSFMATHTDIKIETGARLTVNDVSVGTTGGSLASVTWTVRDAGSAVALNNNGDLLLGQSSSGIVTLNVMDGGALTLGNGGFTQLNTTATINIDGGIVDLKSLVQNGGKINFTDGSLSYTGSLTVGSGGLLGANLTLGPTKHLTVNGATTVSAGSLVMLNDNAQLATGALTNNGEIRVDGLGVQFSATSINNSGVIRGNGRVTANVQTTPTGEIRIGSGQQLHFTGTSFTNAGDVIAIGAAGAPAELTIDGAASNSISTGLIVGREAILQFDLGLNNAGSMALNLGTNDVFGDLNNTGNIVVTGGANATFYDDVTQNGSLTVSEVGSTTSVAVFLGDFTGSGGSSGGGDIFFEGDLRPGASPAEVTYVNDVYFGGGANLQMELGGTESGTEHDKIIVNGALALDGTLSVSLLEQFDPQSGDIFDILDWTTLSGTFDDVQLPDLAGALTWNTSQLYSSGKLSIEVGDLPGDHNLDGTVDAADYVMWRKTDSGNAQGYSDWVANFGQTSGGGSESGSGSLGVPEPGTAAMIIFGVIAMWLGRRQL